MGHLMGIRPFFDKGRYDEVKGELNYAQARDCWIERQSDVAGNHLCTLLSGEDTQDFTKTEYYLQLQNHIPWIRDAFAKHVICPTLNSVDYQGCKIFGMRPYQEHIMLLELCLWEKQALNAITNQMVENAPLNTLIGSTSMSLHFFLVQLWWPFFLTFSIYLLCTFPSSSNLSNRFQCYRPGASCG